MAKKHWIKGAVEGGRGKLHEHLGIKPGEKIPEHTLRAATSSKNSTVRKEANLAMTLGGMHHKKESGPSPSKLRSKMYGHSEKKGE